MLDFESEGSGARLCDGISRRTWLTLGTLGTIGLSLPQWWMARARGGESTAGLKTGGTGTTARACLQLQLSGGPGQHGTWAPKPEAPEGIRGEFRPIATSVPGFRICEHLPRMAQRAHQYAIIRSQTHTGVSHSTSMYH